ncbi:MAG: hypothetical protein JXB62_12500 [Pirellulales bacterium]|nr:hypothetical protein [Pirellulales bacterium]
MVQPSPDVTSKGRFSLRRPPDVVWTTYVLAAVVGVITIGLLGPGPRVGDGYDYYVMLFSWAENLTPYATDRVGEIYEAYVKTRPDAETFPKYWPGWPPCEGAEVELNHFWLYSLLAAVFYWPLKILGLDVGLSYNVLHVVLLFLAAHILNKRLGPAAALSLVLLVLFSPLLWSINKAHGEFYTVMTTTVGMGYFLVGQHVRCAIWMALAATLNPSLAAVTLLAVGFGFIEQRGRLFAENKLRLALLAGILVLHPAYYLVRLGAPTPLLSGGGAMRIAPDLLPLRHMTAFWVDPDVGLLANWPLALPMLVLFLVLACRGAVRLPRKVLAFLGLSILALCWTFTLVSTGFGGFGGTVGVSRYAIWLLFAFFPLQWQLLIWLLGRRRALFYPVATAALALGLWTTWLYRPGLPETCRRPTAVSRLLYAHLPGLYDPMPVVFYNCYGGRTRFNDDETLTWTSWAVSDPSGNKILVWREAMQGEDPQQPLSVVGCPTLDSAAVYRAAAGRFSPQPRRQYVYLNGVDWTVAKDATLRPNPNRS